MLTTVYSPSELSTKNFYDVPVEKSVHLENVSFWQTHGIECQIDFKAKAFKLMWTRVGSVNLIVNFVQHRKKSLGSFILKSEDFS